MIISFQINTEKKNKSETKKYGNNNKNEKWQKMLLFVR